MSKLLRCMRARNITLPMPKPLRQHFRYAMTEFAPKSPCIAVCVLDERDVCMGCYRTGEEITDWFMADNARKQEILEASCARRRAQQRITLD